jgi:hypothetical protein
MIPIAKIKLIFIFFLTFLLGSCSLLKPGSRERAMANERRNEKESAREIQAMEKAHFKAQTAETRKMMKRSHRKAEKLNRAKRR